MWVAWLFICCIATISFEIEEDYFIEEVKTVLEEVIKTILKEVKTILVFWYRRSQVVTVLLEY